MLQTSEIDVDEAGVALHGNLTSDLRAGGSIIVQNMDAANTVFVGGADVTTGNGYPVGPGDEFATDLEAAEVLHGITAAGQVVACRTFVQGA